VAYRHWSGKEFSLLPKLSSHYGFNQPIQAFEHPKFRNMIDIASRATNGVAIPSRKTTREEIVDMFARRMDNLKAHLKVQKCV
jgi:hypothetical protein